MPARKACRQTRSPCPCVAQTVLFLFTPFPTLGLLRRHLSTTGHQRPQCQGSFLLREEPGVAGPPGGLTAPPAYRALRVPGPGLHPPFFSPWSLSSNLCSELSLLLFGRHQALQLCFVRLAQLRHRPPRARGLRAASAHARRARRPPTPDPDFRFRSRLSFPCCRWSSWSGSCLVTASGLLDDLEPSAARWRVSGGSVFSAVPREAEVRGPGGRRPLTQPPVGGGDAGRTGILGGEPSTPGHSCAFGRSGSCPNHSSDHRCLRAEICTRARVASALARRGLLKRTPSGSYSLLRRL